MNQSLTDLRGRYGTRLNAEIESWIATLGEGIFPGMMRYQLGYVHHDLSPSEGGGKRFRPLLCLAVCQAAGGTWEDALPVAAGIELLHNFSLIHDDIEDHDPERHHRSTVWKVWGEPQAINVGDGMFALATRAVAATDIAPAIALDLAVEFQETALRLTRGQHLDMAFETRARVSAEEYMEMISLKSAAIVAYSLWAGATVGGASDDRRKALAAFGQSLGKAFQVHDDIQGIWANRESTGKAPASDLRNRKKTLPVLLAFAAATGHQRTVLERFYTHQEDAVEPVVAVMDQTGAREDAEKKLAELRRETRQHLAEAALPAGREQILAAVIDELTGAQ